MMGPDRFGNSSIEKAVITSTDLKTLDFYEKRLNNKIESDLMDINTMNEKKYTDYM